MNFSFTDSDGKVLESSPSFTLWKADVSTDIPTALYSATAVQNAYGILKVTFSVAYDIFTGNSATLRLTYPSAFAVDGSTTDTLKVLGKSDRGVSENIDDLGLKEGSVVLLDPSSDTKSGSSYKKDVVSVDYTKIYKGRVQYILLLDLKNAKNGKTYKGNVVLKLETA